MNGAAPLLTVPVSDLLLRPEAAARLDALAEAYELRDHYGPRDFDTARPVLLHSDESLLAPLDADPLARRAEPFAARGLLRVVSLHALARCTAPRLEGGMFRPGGRPMDADEMVDNAARNVALLRRVFGPEVVVAVENNNYYPTPAYELVAEPAFLARVVAESGAALLLDAAHAFISARNMGRAAASYFAGLPLAEVVQLHVAGFGESGAVWRDVHEAPTDEQWRASLDLLPRLPNLRYAALEYYRDLDRLVALMERLGAALSAADAAPVAAGATDNA